MPFFKAVEKLFQNMVGVVRPQLTPQLTKMTKDARWQPSDLNLASNFLASIVFQFRWAQKHKEIKNQQRIDKMEWLTYLLHLDDGPANLCPMRHLLIHIYLARMEGIFVFPIDVIIVNDQEFKRSVHTFRKAGYCFNWHDIKLDTRHDGELTDSAKKWASDRDHASVASVLAGTLWLQLWTIFARFEKGNGKLLLARSCAMAVEIRFAFANRAYNSL
jgi:hypothetical protein